MKEVSLESDLVLLRPIAESDADSLWSHTGGDAALWKWVLTESPIPQTSAELRDLIASLGKRDAEGKRLTFAVVLKSSGEVIGSTSYLDPNENQKSVEIGSTFYGAQARRTGVNTHCKYLLMSHAFETLGFERVQIKADCTNAVSLAAIARIGAKEEGILRHDRKRRDGTWRDAVYFSVIAPEWPATKAHIEKLMSRDSFAS
jgi:RimJ/RimL family protein N-acetyltransferase